MIFLFIIEINRFLNCCLKNIRFIKCLGFIVRIYFFYFWWENISLTETEMNYHVQCSVVFLLIIDVVCLERVKSGKKSCLRQFNFVPELIFIVG